MYNENDEYLNTKTARKLLGVTTLTLRKWADEGKIGSIRNPSNQRMYNKKNVYDILGLDTPSPQKKKIVYCRVSSKKQKDDLDRQVDFFKSGYPLHTVVTDIGSGINWKRQGLKTILDQAMSGDISEVVVAHRDRLCRFGFELLEFIFEKCKVKLIVLDRENCKSTRSDLADDILSIIHVYSCKEMGRRRYSTVKESETLSNSKSERNSEEMDRDDEICLQSRISLSERE